MAIRDVFKISRKTFFNPSRWIDLESLKFQNRTIWNILTGLFSTPQPTREESFEQAMERLNLTEEDVKAGARNYRIYALIFLLLGLLCGFYGFYLLFSAGSFTGWILGLAAGGVFLSQAFKYDFWAFQMRRRKLGVSVKEWKNSILGNKGSA